LIDQFCKPLGFLILCLCVHFFVFLFIFFRKYHIKSDYKA
jgi:hypothetical protein